MLMFPEIRLLDIRFENNFDTAQLTGLRGGMVARIGRGAETVLFHNHHQDKTLRYAYPLIQYKVVSGRLNILCLNDGMVAFQQFFALDAWKVNVYGEEIVLELRDIRLRKHKLLLLDQPRYTFVVDRWAALNQDNHLVFRAQRGKAARMAFLERILVGNILAFAKGVGVRFEEAVIVEVEDYQTQTLRFKGGNYTGFRVLFRTNVTLPTKIGLGKHVSIGFGMLSRYDRYVSDHDDNDTESEET